MRNIVVIIFLVAVSAITARESSADEPGWSPVVIATGDYRRQIQSTPIEQRPYRPLHVYGNTIRRVHYRGNPLPLPKGVAQVFNPSQPLGSFRQSRLLSSSD